ncbi:MAG: tRNA (N6-threonylcarbamoyladenosine(37)-N6)-methyltransferase TrmO [Luteolibacter sp.]|jgi:tRNA (adenine37-N6)-methyltransferase
MATTLTPIGIVRTCFGGKFGVPRQPGLCPSAWGRLVFEEPFRNPDALRGIEGFSHVWLIWHFHQTAGRGWSPTVRPPRLGGNKRVGVFASRSTHRPNALGLSLARIEGVDTACAEAPVILLGGIDLIDGTPIFDIKPYLPYAESHSDAAAGYAGGEIPRLPVDIAPPAADAFAALPPRAQSLIRESLTLDPRPAGRSEDGESPTTHGAHLCGHNIRFRVNHGRCEILGITPSSNAGDSLPPDLSSSTQ